MEQRAASRLAVMSQHLAPAPDAQVAMVLGRQFTAATLGSDPTFPQATTAAAFPPSVSDALGLDTLLTPEERAVRDKVRRYMEKEVAPVICGFWERAEFPHQLVPSLATLGLAGGGSRGYGCPNLSIMSNAIAVVEMARVDGSLSTFLLVHSYLAMLTISLLASVAVQARPGSRALFPRPTPTPTPTHQPPPPTLNPSPSLCSTYGTVGSEDQKQELLPRLASFDLVGCWALTEPSNGSDASALTCTATKVPGGWMLDGHKRWIGNGTFADVVVVWARSSESGQVNAFIVRKGAAGFKPTKIENKIALRCVQNADMTFERCFVPDSARLPGVESFKDTNKVLAISRIMVAWQPVGLAMGVYDVAARYVAQREQFGTPLGGFQLVQERLVRMLGNIQAMFLMAWRLSKLYEEGRMTHEQASLVKSWTTLRGREVMALGREILGGNGILTDFNIAKAFCDLEAYYTYEGTYDVNVLVAGRGITGVGAIRAPQSGKKKQAPVDVQA